ncbi:phage tail tape measure protein [Selenomonas ruminantium]|uniref:phage tail tape measure protein n=1 Tax=Selenomonas ruminantium TaxID=971 RepID=UPI0003F5F321|nr:phage tail tape measure protein [Selenomonas ruminantium]
MATKEMAMVFALKGVLDSSFGSSAKTAAQSFGKIKSEAAKLKTAIQETERAQKMLDQAFKAGGMSEATYKKRMAEMKANLKEYNKALGDASMQQAKQAKGKLDDGGGGMFDGIAGAISKYKGLIAVAAPVYDILKQSTEQAMHFESVMADVRKVVDFDSPQQFKDMQNDILNLTKTLPMTAEDIAKIVAAGGQSGIARKDLLSFAEAAAKMGVAFDITAEQAGDMMAKWRTAFKLNQTDVISLADKINYLGNTTAAAAPLISDVVTRIGPLGEIGGVASGEIAALGASMVGTGVQSDVAATGIKNLILGMVAGEGATKSQAAAFKSLGLNAVTMAQRMQKDARGAIIDVFKAIQKLDKYQQATVLADLFGKESIGAISPLLSNLDALQDNFNKVADASKYAGSMQSEFDARCETTENSMNLLKNAVSRTAINLGSLFLPAVKNVVEGMANAIDQATQFVQTHQELLQNIAAVAGIVGAAVVAYKGFIILQSAIQAFSMLSVVLRSAAAAQALLNTVMMLNPLGLVIAAVAALAAGLFYLWNTNEGFRAAVIAAWEAVYNTAVWAFNSAYDTISSAMNAAEQYVADKIETIKSAWENLREFLAHPIDVIVRHINQGVSAGGDDYDNAGIDSNATGGIYGQGAFLTTFAETSPEAAIPIDGSRRAESLWRRTGEMMGLTGGGESLNVSLSIPVTIQGNADHSTAVEIQQNIDAVVERALSRIQHQRGRVSYA